MTWTALRQQRYVFSAFAVVAVALMGWALLSGSREESDRARWLAAPCRGGVAIRQRDYAVCNELLHASHGSQDALISSFAVLLVVLLGVLLGAAAIARDLERGTTRLVWTQSVTRARWYVTKVVVGLGSLALIAAPMCVVFSWWLHASSYDSRISPTGIIMSGWMPLVIAVLSFALAVIIGVLLRHAGWTTAVALAVLVLLSFGEHEVLYELVLHGVTTYTDLASKDGKAVGVAYGLAPAKSWTLYSGFDAVDAGGVVPTWPATLSMNAKVQNCEVALASRSANVEATCLRRLDLRRVTIYVSDREYWTLQLRAGGTLLGGSVLMLGAGAVVLRRRRA